MTIMGDCPHDDCDHFEIRIIPDVDLPVFSREKCRGCGKPLWVLYSRVDPQVFTDEEFAKEYDVDETTKRVSQKPLDTPLDGIDESV